MRVLVFFAVGMLVLGCSSEGAGPECHTSADCEGAAICLEGKCQILGCQGGCPDGTYCDELSSECVDCDVDEHCGASCLDCTVLATDRACVNGACGCRSEFHCAAGQTCENDKCVGCLPDCQGKCGGADDGCGGACDEPCDSEHWCDAQICEPCGDGGRCGFCLTCDGQGNCVDVTAGEDPFDDCAGEPPCGQVCGGDGGCVFPDSSVVCGLDCQRCDGDGNCVADCSQSECRQNVWDCQCHPMPTELTCGSTAGGDLSNLDDTTDLFGPYPAGCNWTGNPLDGREATYDFSFSGTPSPRQVAVSVYSVCGVSEIVALVMAGDHPCDPEQCVASQNWSGFA